MEWMRPMRLLASMVQVVVVATVLATGCGGDGGAPATPDGAPIEIDAGCVPGPDATPSSQALGDVNGSWAVLELSHARVGQPLNSVQISRELYTFTITQTGTDLAIVEQMCDIQVDDASGLESTRMLPSLWPSLPPVNRIGSLVADGAGGFTLTTMQAYRTRGITLVNIETDPLPTDASDPRIEDWDEDSHPGITLLLDGILRGQAYVIQRDWNMYNASQVGIDLIEGHTMWDSEQVYLGSDPDSIAELNISADPDPDPSKHTVQLVRIPAGSDCAYVTANQCTLFAGK